MKIIKFIFFLISTIVIWLNIALYKDNFDRSERKKDIVLQLNFLSQELKVNHLGDSMQGIFPEGFVFANVLYGLSWCEVGLAENNLKDKENALKEALFAYNQINSSKAKSTFDASLNPENGIFYLGWKNYLLSKILLLDANFKGSDVYNKMYNYNCESIVNALKSKNTPFLESYRNQAWPADMCVAMASLSNYEKINDNRYKSVIKNWVAEIKSNIDPKTGLIPHKVNPENSKMIEGARGCSISLIIKMLSEIDLDFSKEQYKNYKKHFMTTSFGLPSINEYRRGTTGTGDIDSGPVIFGVGFSGTIVSIGTFAVMGDYDLAEKQYKTINAFGFSYRFSEQKKYIFGQLPIADAFIAWSRSAELHTSNSIEIPFFWAYRFHLISLLLVLILWGLLKIYLHRFSFLSQFWDFRKILFRKNRT